MIKRTVTRLRNPSSESGCREKRRIALVVPELDRGGGVPAVARFIKRVIEQSAAYDLALLISLSSGSIDVNSVNLTQPSSWPSGIRTSFGVWDGSPYTHVGAFLGEFEFQRYRPRRVLSAMLAGCDLIQLVCGSPAWANALSALGKPVSVQCATRASVERRRRNRHEPNRLKWWRKVMTGFTDRIEDSSLRSVQAVQVENQWMLEYVRKVTDKRSLDLRFAPPGIDAGLYRPAPVRDFERDPYILSVGRLDDPRKNVGLLLEAYNRIPQQSRGNLRLQLAGQHGPTPEFWRRAASLGLHGNVTFTKEPSTDELIRLYQNAAMFALSSDEEGFGMVLLESMACGVPVISTRCGGPEDLISDGADGYLVPLDDASTLSDRITKLWLDRSLNVRLAQSGRDKVETHYASDVAGQRFLDVWDHLLNAKGATPECAA